MKEVQERAKDKRQFFVCRDLCFHIHLTIDFVQVSVFFFLGESGILRLKISLGEFE